jgi:hypothetical protein
MALDWQDEGCLRICSEIEMYLGWLETISSVVFEVRCRQDVKRTTQIDLLTPAARAIRVFIPAIQSKSVKTRWKVRQFDTVFQMKSASFNPLNESMYH